ncbi:meso-butanediol dehydrogenase/(S,S)-butanediol dehydrogenase/diacetyl reductase [Microbacterium sp. SLBN-154]|nr:meso-butanediol dehydrogenase/(S,S)-butanediol dehydrogenase/diacetyl reductase [Microbacterium sp. SLBN-154]
MICVARSAGHLESTVASLRADGISARGLTADLSVAAERQSLAEALQDTVDLRAVVNNAGGAARGGALDTALEDFDAALEIDVRAAWDLGQRLASRLAENAGSIVNVASTVALAVPSGRGLYSSAKGALVAATRSMAIDLARTGVRVNAVAPGPTLTEGLRTFNTDEQLAERATKVPLGRLADPADIADAIEFLCSHRARHITGQVLVVDGGASVAGMYI